MVKFIAFFCLFIYSYAQEPIKPIPHKVFYDEEKASLGKELFFDTILSGDGKISCSSCHELPGNGAGHTALSQVVIRQEPNVNTPTILNATFNFTQFWDGRAKNLYEQATIPITSPLEMNSSMSDVIQKLNNSTYKEKFLTLFDDGVTERNIAEVISEFEKALVTPNSKFDLYLRGDENALNEQEKRGYKIFQETGCISCHNGVNIGGNMFQKLGVMVAYDHFNSLDIEKVYKGRYEITKRERDKFVFKVPTLRNIALTAPYLHDGSVQTLREVIVDMREHQFGARDDGPDVDDIEAFLKTLTGETPSILKDKIK